MLENNTRIAHKSIATSITHIKLASICTIIGIASIDNDYFLSSYTLAHWSNALNQFNTIKPHEALLMKDIYDSKVKNQSFQLSEEQKKTLQILDGNGASENYSLRKLIDLYLIKPQSQTKEFSISPTTDSEENSPILSQDILPLDQIQLSAQKTNTSSSNLTIPFIAKNSWRYLGKGVLPKYKNKIKPTQSTAFDIQHRSQQSQVTMGTDALMPEETIFTSPNRLEDEPYVVTRINPAESESVSVSTWNSIKQSANQVIETISTQVKSWYNWLTGMFR